MRHSMEHDKQMIVRNEEVNETAPFHVGKREGEKR